MGLCLLLTLALAPSTSRATTLPGTAPVVIPSGGFGVDGDLLANTPTNGIGDWVRTNSSGGGFVLLTNGTPVNPVTTLHVIDPYASAVDDSFSTGKYVDNPNTGWQWHYGSVSDKTDINHAVVHITTAANGHQWALVSGDRASANGASYIDFEFLQDTLTLTPTNALGLGGFTNGAPHGGRRVNDFLLTLAFTSGGASADFSVQQWKTNAASGGFTYADVDIATTLPPNSVFAAVSPINGSFVPYGAFGGTTYAQNTFAEAAVDLTALLGSSFDPCTRIAVKSILVKTKQSPSPSAALGDLTVPVQVNLTLGLADAGPPQTNCSAGASTSFNITGNAHPNFNAVTNMSWSVVSGPATIVSGGSCANCMTLPAVVTVAGSATNAILRLTVKDTSGCGTSDEVILTVNPSTSAVGPANQNVCPGTTASLSTVVSGTGPFSYQWFKNGSLINGQTGSALTFANVTSADSGNYCVAIVGACSSVTNCATLTVLTNTSAIQPASATLCQGSTANFSTVASGTGPFSYQWTKDGFLLAGATASSLSVPSISSADAGQYCVQVTGTCGSVTNCALLTVRTNTSATALVSLTNCPGTPASFSTVASGSGPFSYQWSKNGGDMSGATDSSYSVAAANSTDAGTYCVRVTGLCTSVTNCATLTVLANATATSLTSQTNCLGTPAGFSTVAGGTGPFSYQWTKNGSPISGATDSSYSIAAVTADDVGNYCVQVTGRCGSATKCADLALLADTSATPPASLTLCPANGASFTTTASGTGPFNYQWTKNGNNISGATGSSYAIASVTADDAGTYCVSVTGVCGRVTNCATLTVLTNTSATPLNNLTLCPGSPASFSTAVTGTGPYTFQWTKAGAPIGGATDSAYSIAAIQAGDAGTYCVEVRGFCTSVTNCATLTVLTNTSATPPASLTLCPGSTANFSTIASGTGPFAYQWTKAGAPLPGATSSSLSISNLAASDAGQYCVKVTGACTSVTNCASLTVLANTSVTRPNDLTLCPGSTASFSAIASGSGPFSFQWTRNGSPLAGANGPSLSIPNIAASDAGQYCVEVTGTCIRATNCATLTVLTNTGATQPANQAVCAGNAASFSTVASGTGPFSYQWTKNGVAISGATRSSYSITAAANSDVGTYCVRVTGACTSVTNCATLTILKPGLTLTKACPPIPVPPGGVLVFSGTVSNSGAVTLTNIVVINNRPTNGTPVIGPVTLAPGESANFTGSYSTPEGGCGPCSDTLSATANALCTGSNVATSITATCPLATTPALGVDWTCPPGPVLSGVVCFYQGTVSNAGNATLTNVIVVSSLPTNNTTIFGPAILAPGEAAVFEGCFMPPVDTCGSLVNTLTANGGSICNGSEVTRSVTHSCSVTTTPRLTLVKRCPANPVSPGDVLNFSGTVSNAGNVTLTNVIVVNNQPVANTPVTGPLTLAPGQAAEFADSYAVCPVCCPPYVDTLTATGNDRCTGAGVTVRATAACGGTVSPALTVTKDCPPDPVMVGQPLVFSGIVSNAGNVTLNNVIVTDDKAGFLRQIVALAPREVADYTASYTPADCGPSVSTVTATGENICGNGLPTSSSVTGVCAVDCEPLPTTTILDPHGEGTNVVFSFETKAGINYTVECTPSLAPPVWQTLTNLLGTGGVWTMQDPCTETQRFYRVLTQ